MHKKTLTLLLITVCGLGVIGCSKKTTPTSPAVTSQPTSIAGTVTDSLGNPLDSVAIKVQYSFVPATKGMGKAPLDSVSSFSAMIVPNGIQLNWRTESESNSYRWEIQRSLQQDTGFAVIASLNAMGTTSTPHDYSYTDSTVASGTMYFFRLCLVDMSSLRTYFGPVSAGPLPIFNDAFPGCTPIPVIGNAQITFKLAGSSQVALGIRRNSSTVRTLINTILNRGTHAVSWNGNDDTAKPVPSGFYQAVFAITRHDTVKTYTQPVFVNIADSSSGRVNGYSAQQGTFTCSGLPVDSMFFMKGPAGEDLGSVRVATSVTIYACKPGYPVASRTIVLAKNASNTVNFVLK